MKRTQMLNKIRKAVLKTIIVEDEKLVFDPDLISEEVLKTVEIDMYPPLLQDDAHPYELIFNWEKEN